MPAGRRGLLATAAICAAAAASLTAPSGCAETDELSDRLSKARYLIELRAVVADVRRSVRHLSRFEELPSIPELERRLDQATAEFGRIVDRLESIEPPEAVFLDDIGSNLKAARALGMTTIKVEEPDAALAELERVTGLVLRDATPAR